MMTFKVVCGDGSVTSIEGDNRPMIGSSPPTALLRRQHEPNKALQVVNRPPSPRHHCLAVTGEDAVRPQKIA